MFRGGATPTAVLTVIDPYELASNAPVILVGRGGSGTRLLAQLALPSGLFLGNDLNPSDDSMEWIDLIYRLALEALAGESRVDRRAREAIRETAAAVLQRGDRRPGELWGWKLPETVFVLPAILDAFPGAKVVHLVRHPITSALRRTHMTSRLDNLIGQAALPAAYRHLGRDLEAMASDDVHIHNAVSWLFQVQIALESIDTLPESRRLLLHFEDICAAPAAARRRCSAFSAGRPSRRPHRRLIPIASRTSSPMMSGRNRCGRSADPWLRA